MPRKSKRKAGKKAGARRRTNRKKVSRGKKTSSRVRLTRTKIPAGGAEAQIHQGTGAARAPEIAPATNGDASN